MCTFLPGSDSNISCRLNLSPDLSCLDISLRLGRSGECWQGVCHFWHFNKPHLVQKYSTNSHWNLKKNYWKQKSLQRLYGCHILGRQASNPNPHPASLYPFIMFTSCLLPILPKQRGRLCTWTVDDGEVFGVSYQLY